MSDFSLFFVWELPEVGLAVLAVLGLFVSVLARKFSRESVGLFVAAQALWVLVSIGAVVFFRPVLGIAGHLCSWISSDHGCDLGRIGIMGLGLFINLMVLGSRKLRQRGLEFPGLVMAATVALMILAQSTHLVLTFVSLEVASLLGVILISYSSAREAKGGLRYLIVAGISATMMLWGMALLGASCGGLDYAALQGALSLPGACSSWAKVGVALILAGVGVKMGLFPFGYYLPAVYECCHWVGVGFLATLSKVGAVVALIGLLSGPFLGLRGALTPALILIAALSLLWGALSAMRQGNFKRLLALSGVVHAGFILAGVALGLTHPALMQVAWFYLVGYCIAVSLIIMVADAYQSRDDQIESFKDLYRRNPFLGIAGVAGVASLAGLPPMVGFLAKFMVFWRAAQTGSWALVGVMLLVSLFALYYYFKLIQAFMGRAELTQTPLPEFDPKIHLSYATTVALGLLLVMLVTLGLCPGLLSMGC